MDQLDQPVQILGRDRFVLLVEVVDVAVEDLDEELDGNGGVHACVGDAEGALQAFEDALAVAVELGLLVSDQEMVQVMAYVFGIFATFVAFFFVFRWEGLDWDRPP